ncbi:hypothetical protein PoB_000028700 [Plakobranchus ocellatus]|uniref:Uncharacterized protein n=1 Tax=Plakobranchus ocellatus TaxID=259542 RepID=A0AAV3XUD0_9GAST|nr:hypothetical protein PoB_000028700 [Plakobranchus ocellatus]
MAFGREGGTRMGGENSIYASHQDISTSSANPPHWMKQLEEKYQRLHAKIVNQAAKFSNARFNAINNNINYNRSLSNGGNYRSNSITKSSTSTHGGDGIKSVLSKRGSSLSTNSFFESKHGPCDRAVTQNTFLSGEKSLNFGESRRHSVRKPLIRGDSTGRKSRADKACVNTGFASFPVSAHVSKWRSGEGDRGDDSGGDSGLTSSSTPTLPPCPDNVSTTQPGSQIRLARLESGAEKVTQAETCDPVRTTLAKTSAAIALLNSTPSHCSLGQVRRKSKGGTGSSRLKSPQRSALDLRQQALESKQIQSDEDGGASESVCYIPAGTPTNARNKTFNNSNFNCFENEVSGGASVQNTPRTSKPTTRASSSLALTRLSSANVVSVSRTHSRLNEEILVSDEHVNDNQGESEKERNFFIRRREPFVSDDQLDNTNNGDINLRNCDEINHLNENDEIEDDKDDGEYYSSDESIDYSEESNEDVFVEEDSSEDEKYLSQCQQMDIGRAKGRRHGSRGPKSSANRLGQKPHKSCPTYFWKSANPYGSAEEEEEEKTADGFVRTAAKANTGFSNLKKNKKNSLHKRDRRSHKSHHVKKNNIGNTNINNEKNHQNNSSTVNKDTYIDEVGNEDNGRLDYDLDENANNFEGGPNYNHRRSIHATSAHGQHRDLNPHRDSKGNISPVLGTILPLTARAVEEGRMRVFARMSLEARHAVDETLREMEKDEGKEDKEKVVERNLEADSLRPGHLEANSQLESTFDVSVMNNTSGTRGASRALGDGDLAEAGETGDVNLQKEKDLSRMKGGGGSFVGESQVSTGSDNLHDEFYAAKKYHSSNPNLYNKLMAHQEVTHSPCSSIGPYKRTSILGQRASSRRLPHLADVPIPAQSSSLPNPHARLPGIGTKPRLPLSYRETTFEITPPDFDIRFHHIITCHTEDRETPPPDIRQQSIEKCQQWLVRHNPK